MVKKRELLVVLWVALWAGPYWGWGWVEDDEAQAERVNLVAGNAKQKADEAMHDDDADEKSWDKFPK